MKNIYLLPSKNNKSKLATYCYDESKNIKVGELGLQLNNTIGWSNCWSPRECYITSDEEIKKGDSIFETDTNTINVVGKDYVKNELDFKIILTTDQDLIADGVQAIDDEFLEWFVKNPSCEVVEVNWVKTPDGIFYHQENVPYGCYKIIIPKEELTKDEIDKFFVDMVCNPKEPKQETLEEAANKAYCFYGDVELREAFELGAKWQQERSYSEEEVWKLVNKLNQTLNIGSDLTLEEWFEQFKKK